MKTVAFALLFCSSFLAAQPMMPVIQNVFNKEDACKMSCCHKHAEKKNHKKAPFKNCCNGMMCNPFGQYACCTGFVVEKEAVAAAFVEAQYKVIPEYKASVINGVCSDCWRPPENTVS